MLIDKLLSFDWPPFGDRQHHLPSLLRENTIIPLWICTGSIKSGTMYLPLGSAMQNHRYAKSMLTLPPINGAQCDHSAYAKVRLNRVNASRLLHHEPQYSIGRRARFSPQLNSASGDRRRAVARCFNDSTHSDLETRGVIRTIAERRIHAYDIAL